MLWVMKHFKWNHRLMITLLLSVVVLAACGREVAGGAFVVAQPVEYAEPVTLSAALRQLPDSVQVRGLDIVFQNGGISTLALSEPTASLDSILEQYEMAKEIFFGDLGQAIRSASLQGSEADQVAHNMTLEDLDAIAQTPATGESIRVARLLLDGSEDEIEEFADSVQ